MTLRVLAVFALVLALAAVTPAGAQRPDAPALLIEAADQKAIIEGNLIGAIQAYEAIATTYATSHPSEAALALLRAAVGYRTMGDEARARAAYERLAKEHGDQPPAVIARSELAALTRHARAIWAGSTNVNQAGNVSADGRYIPFVDQETGDLAVRDLVTGTNRRLTNNTPDRAWDDFTEWAAISRDGGMVAYSWWVDNNTNELRLLPRTSSGTPSPRVLIRDPEIRYVVPLDWSPNGEWLVVRVQRRGNTEQMGIVTVSDSSYQSLKSVPWGGLGSHAAVSPDSRFIAYTLRADAGDGRRDIYVIGRDGQRAEQRVDAGAAYNAVVGWAPDGRTLLFATERAGTMVLSAVTVIAGVPQGAPRVVEPDLGTFDGSAGVTNTGSLVFLKKTAAREAFTSALDFATGTVSSRSVPVTDRSAGGPEVMWSPDGKSLAWVSSGRGRLTVMIRSLETGVVPELIPRATQLQFPRWTADRFMTFQTGGEIFALDVESGETRLLVRGGDGRGYRSWADATPDGRHVLYTIGSRGGIVVRNLQTGEDRELVAPDTGSQYKAVSPDGRWVAYSAYNPSEFRLMIVPFAGGEPREILKVSRPEWALGPVVEWMPDGRRLVTSRRTGGELRLIVVPIDGGPIVELPPAIAPLGTFFRIHPDGQRVAYSQGTNAWELWTLENVLSQSH